MRLKWDSLRACTADKEWGQSRAMWTHGLVKGCSHPPLLHSLEEYCIVPAKEQPLSLSSAFLKLYNFQQWWHFRGIISSNGSYQKDSGSGQFCRDSGKRKSAEFYRWLYFSSTESHREGKGHLSPKTSNRRAVHICGPVASFPDFIHSFSKYLTVHFFSARH